MKPHSLLPVFLFLFIPVLCMGQPVISINIAGGIANSPSAGGGGGEGIVTGTAGIGGLGNWNNAIGSSNTGAGLSVDNLVESMGRRTSASVSWVTNNTWSTATADGQGGDVDMMSGYIDDFHTNGSISVSGLGPAFTGPGYNVLVYYNTDNGGMTAGFNIVDSLGNTDRRFGHQVTANGNYPLAGGEDGYIISTETDPATNLSANVVQLRGLSGPGFTMTGVAGSFPGGSNRARPNAIQIIAQRDGPTNPGPGPEPGKLGDLTYTTTNGEVTITDCDRRVSGELAIPDTIGGNPVRTIGKQAFEGCEFLTSIEIPNSVTSIGAEAFQTCLDLASITIPDSVNSIGDTAFAECMSLTSITIPDSVTIIEDAAFYLCTSLTSITIPDSVTSIGHDAFGECENLTSITFLGTAPTVGGNGFSDVAGGAQAFVTAEALGSFGQSGGTWNGLSIQVGDGPTNPGPGPEPDKLGDLTYTTTNGEVTITDCDRRVSGELVIPGTIGGNPVRTIGKQAFEGCEFLTSIEIPNSVNSIGAEAFQTCLDLASITIPDSVTSIGDTAFAECMSLTSITIPDSVTSIEDAAFYLCTSLTSITIPDSVTSIGSWAFGECENLTSITFLGTAPTVGGNGFSDVAGGAQAFVTAEALGSFGQSGGTWNGLSIQVGDGPTNPGPGPEPGKLGDLTYTTTNGEVTITDCDRRVSGELVIPGTIGGNPVRTIGNEAFEGCEFLTSIEIPNSVTSIGAEAFQDCLDLASIEISNSVTSIEDAAFYLCTSLTSITIPDSVTSIGSWAFGECENLTSITFLGTAPTVGGNGFWGVPEGAQAFVTAEALGSFGQSGGTWNGLSIQVGDDPTNIGEIAQLEAQLAQITAERDAAIAERDARPTLESYIAVVAERDARPTAEQLATVEAERDARFTDDQIRALSVDYTIGLNEAGNVQIKFHLFESADLNAFAPLTLTPDSVSVVDGSICLELAPTDDAAFYRFSVE